VCDVDTSSVIVRFLVARLNNFFVVIAEVEVAGLLYVRCDEMKRELFHVCSARLAAPRVVL